MRQLLILLLAILLFVVAVLFGYGFFAVYMGNGSLKSLWPKDVVDAYRAGNFEQAITKSKEIESDPNRDINEKAMATYNALGAEYRLTGNPDALLRDVQNMKQVITNPAVTIQMRADMLDVLSKEYVITGRNPAVFAEIYKDAPFNQYLAPNDPELSTRHLAEWSYSLFPTSNAAIMVATWYASQLVNNHDLSASTTKAYTASASEYLTKADAASVTELNKSPSYKDSRRYIYYLFYRTVVTGQLANYMSQYKDMYRSAYDQFFAFASGQQNVIAREFVLFAHLSYAQQLSRDNDTALAKTHLDQLANLLNAVPANEAKSNGFFQNLRNESKNNPDGDKWKGILKMEDISPDFKAAVEKIVSNRI